MAQWQKGDEVWAARWGYPNGKIDVLAVRVASAGPKQARFERMHDAMGYRTNIGHDEGSRSRREALLVLKSATAAELEGARSRVLLAESQLLAVEAAIAALEES